MRFIWPRSVLGLLLVGFSLVALPLAGAVIQAGFSVDKLAERSQRLVIQGVHVTRMNDRLSGHITDMERYARQYYVVGDPALWGLYLENKAAFTDTLISLQGLDGEQRLSGELADLNRVSEDLDEGVPSREKDGDGLIAEAPPETVARFSELRTYAARIARSSNTFIDTELETLDAEAATAQSQLIWHAWALIPITIFFAALFTTMIAQPVRQLRTAIGNLGRRDYIAPIAIGGPVELRGLGSRLDWLRERLRESDETKNTFLRHISHELKTPLASLREGTELLCDGTLGGLSPTQSEVADILLENCMKLQSLIENLLGFSAWQHNAFRLSLSRLDFRSLVNEVLEQQALEIRRRRVAIKLEPQSVTLVADPAKLKVAIENLLANAIKFSPPGSAIRIILDSDERFAYLDIIDAGPGVSAANSELVFEPFFQGDAPPGLAIRGTGIGLSVVRETAQAHGGRVSLETSGNQGGHFRLMLPLQPPAQNPDA